MDLQQAEKMALELIQKHLPGVWRFGWDNARRRLGKCSYQEGLITLSRPYTQIRSEANVRNTILHEIAHALTPFADHGLEWKMVAIRIGAKPEACGNIVAEGLEPLKGKWIATCPNGHVANFYRKPKAGSVRSCAKCCRYFSPEFIMTWKHSGSPMI